MSAVDPTVDVVVVGGRCAGSALGAHLARRGVRVVVLEQAPVLRSTLSSNILQADSLAFLHDLGVTGRLRAAGVTPMNRVDMRLEDFRCIAPFPLRAGDIGGSACIRREVLDPILLDAARDAGADVRLGVKVSQLVHRDGRVVGVRTTARDGVQSVLRSSLVVGADGRQSTVARLCGARQYHVTGNERQYYWTYFEGADLGLKPTFVSHRWGDRHVLGGPADHGLYIVGVSPQAGEQQAFRADADTMVAEHVRACDPVARAVSGARRASPVYGIRHFQGYFREGSGPGWVLVGDAGHFKDPAGGRGIGDAFEQARVLAELLAPALATTGPTQVDAAAAAFVARRDRTYAEYYWLACDLGVAGPIASVVPETVRRLRAQGRTDAFLDLLAHRASVQQVLTPARVAGAAARLMLRPTQGGRRRLLREVTTLATQQLDRRRRERRPALHEPPGRRPAVPHPTTASPALVAAPDRSPAASECA